MPPDYGAQPTFAQAVSIAEAHIRANLVDPESARFVWPNNFVAGVFDGAFSKKRAGYWTCGRVNARNPMGGYSGAVPLFVMVKNGKVIDYELGDPTGEVSPAQVICERAAKSAQLPPAPR